MGNNLISWLSKKQNSISISTAKVEYIVASSCCTQLLWIKQILSDYGINKDFIIVICDNTSFINIYNNHVQHFRTKHINICHHFIRDLVARNIIVLEHIHIEGQLVDLLTKALYVVRFETW